MTAVETLDEESRRTDLTTTKTCVGAVEKEGEAMNEEKIEIAAILLYEGKKEREEAIEEEEEEVVVVVDDEDLALDG